MGCGWIPPPPPGLTDFKKPGLNRLNGRKKLFSLQNVMKKVVQSPMFLEKNCLQVPKMVTPVPKQSTKITRQMKKRKDGELNSRHKNNSPKDGQYKNTSLKR